MSNILEQIVARKREIVDERKQRLPLAELPPRPPAAQRDFAAALRLPGMSVIAEIKRRSPSKGALHPNLDPVSLARQYEAGGARALSVLTEGDHFGGSDDDLNAARSAVGLPVLRKDFTIDEYQVREARALGADAILLIVRILDDAQLRDFGQLATELGLAALVEVHNAAELDRALASGARIVGVNNRNLATFETTLDTCLGLRSRIPPDCVAVAESGIFTRSDVVRLEASRFDAVLVGEALVKAGDATRGVQTLLGTAA